MFLGIFFLSIYNIIALLFITLSIIDLIHRQIIANNLLFLLIGIVLIAIPDYFVLRYLHKHSGRLYLYENHFILKKHRQEFCVNISDIKWIELKHDRRATVHKGWTTKASWKYCIRLNNQKSDLDYLITNNIMLNIIEQHDIRIMPDDYSKNFRMDQLKSKQKSR